MSRVRARRALAVVVAVGSVAGMVAGCVAQPASQREASAPTGRAEPEEKERPVRIFADEAFYRERPEPEETLRGILHAVEARPGPDTREHPLELETEGRRYGVYVAGVDPRVLSPFVGRTVEVTGKRVDLRSEGFDVEIWIGTLALAGSPAGPEGP